MTTINTTNIDVTYPIAGQDNDSQGFRDNFTNIQTNLDTAGTEIQELQDNVILKGALITTGQAIDNDMTGTVLHSAEVRNIRESIVDAGSVTGAIPIDVSAAPYHKLATSGSITLSFTAFSVVGTHSVVKIEIDVTNVAHTLTLPAEVTLGVNSLYNVSANVVTFATAGKKILEFSSADAGASIAVDDLTESRISDRQILVSAPAASIGAAGDLPGMIAFDATYIYLCTAAYDGSTLIWTRASAATW